MSKLFHYHLERIRNLFHQEDTTGENGVPIRSIDDYAIKAGYPEGYYGKGVTIGIIYLGGGHDPDNLNEFFAKPENHRKEPNLDRIVTAYGENKPVDKDTLFRYLDGKPVPPHIHLQASSTVECTGGLEIVAGLAPEARIKVYYSKGLNGDDLKGIKPTDMDDAFMASIIDVLTFIADEDDRPDILSMSWAFGELPGSDFVHEAYRKINDKLAVISETTTMMCASGDYGSNNVYCPDFALKNPRVLSVAFPASSPYVTACGGMNPRDNNYGTLDVWNQKLSLTSQMASTGGVSALFTETPAWQAGVGVNQKTGSDGRGVPDISALADSNNGIHLDLMGRTVSSGGTSASAPLLSSLFACIYEGLEQSLGFLNPYLYHDDVKNTFCPINSGNNAMKRSGSSSFDALENEWDPCTGWGAPLDGTTLMHALRQVIEKQNAG